MEIHLLRSGRFLIGFLLLIFPQLISADQACAPGLKSPGYTSPPGDLYRTPGTELIINCTLHASSHRLNSGHIRWERNNIEVNSSCFSILDDRTSQLRLPNLEKGMSTVFCRATNSSDYVVDVCRNTVFVGAPPPEVQMNCTSYDFQNITCRWKLPPAGQNIQTKWTFRTGTGVINNCMHPIENYYGGCTCLENYCPLANVSVFLKGSNGLGNATSSYTFNQHKNVVISAPRNFSYSKVENNSACISWTQPINNCLQFLREPLPSIDYLIIVTRKNQEKHDSYELHEEVNTGKEFTFWLRNLTPFTDYFVESRSRLDYDGHKNLWGDASYVRFKTKASVPPSPPRNLMASISSNSTNMNVTLYWTGIPEEQHYGQDFRYSIEINGNIADGLKYETTSTTNTYFQFIQIPVQSSQSFRVRSANEAGESQLSSDFFISDSQEVNDQINLRVDDVIIYNGEDGLRNYTVSWTVSDSQVYNLSLYWCRGNRSIDGITQCDESGLRLQEEVSSNEANYTFSFHEPSPQEHLFGIAIMEQRQSQRIFWSPCTISATQHPRSPNFYVESIEPTSVYLSLDPLKCEDKAVGITGYNLYVYDANGKEIKSSSYRLVKEETKYNVSNLKPNTNYKVAITTTTLFAESEKQPRAIRTGSSTSKPEDDLSVAAIVFPVLLGAAILILAGYWVYKRFRDKIDGLHIDPPTKLKEDYYEERWYTDSSRNVPEKLVERKFKLPSLSRKTKEEELNSPVLSSSGFIGNGVIDLSLLSLPVGPVGSSPHESFRDSGYDLDTPESDCDVTTSLFKFGNPTGIDDQKTPTSSNKGYCRAVVLSPSFLPQFERQQSATEGIDENPMIYTRVSTYVTCATNNDLPNSRNETHVNPNPDSSYVQIVGFNSPELSTEHSVTGDSQGLPSILVSSVDEPQLIVAQGDAGIIRSPHSNEIERLNCVGGSGYAQVTVAMDQLPSSQHPTDRSRANASDNVDYVKVTTAEDETRTSLPAPYLEYSAFVGYKNPCVAMQLPNTTQSVLETSNTTCDNQFDNMTATGDVFTNTSDINTEGIADVSTSSIPTAERYVAANSLSTLTDSVEQVTCPQEPLHPLSSDLRKA